MSNLEQADAPPAALERAAVVFSTGAATHKGLVRSHNEDRFFVDPGIGAWAVADGVGGHEGGQFASSTVVDALKSIGTPVSAADLLARFEDRVVRANAILRQAGRDRGGAIVGTTIAGILICDGYFACLWSGDSRVYLVRDKVIKQISRDHSAVQEMVDRGLLTPDEARRWPGKNVITRALGIDDEPVLDLEQGALINGDIFVICSDGLTNHVEDHEIGQHAASAAAQAACDGLVALTLERGASDNVTVVVVHCSTAAAV